MNDFEKDPNDKGNDVIHAGIGFAASFVFFSFIFALGVVISYFN
ncbi:MAG TPA: YqzM family protein [Pseudogracilibacillus sp.]|nr:YqzM family protein [Pseudogracilibacillus sp.]